MAFNATVISVISVSGAGVNETDTLAIIQNTNSPAFRQPVLLNEGLTTIPVPATAVGVTIIPPAGSANSKALASVITDAGIALHPSNPSRICFATPLPANLYITAPGSETLTFYWF